MTSATEDTSRAFAFEHETRVIAIDAILPLKVIKPEIKQTPKYQQIASSIDTVGLIEPPVVIPDAKATGRYFLLDGLLRIECLKDRSMKEVECLISTDDEAYTYNKRINRLASVQEHRMVVRAIELGASVENIAKAFGMDPNSVRRRSRLLDGICPETASLLEDKHCPMIIFDYLKRMKPIRQMEAAELMVGQRNFTSAFAKAILATTPPEQLAPTKAKKAEVTDITREQIARLERELESVHQLTSNAEETYGEDNLTLTIAKTYLAKLLGNTVIVRWLSKKRPEILGEFQAIAEITSLNASTNSVR